VTLATVIIPTTGDRGPLLEFSVGSVLRQSLSDLEVFVVGDGVSASTRATIKAICAKDERVRFVDREKHSRRGEPIRDEILRDVATGRIVTYLCDRDLWFSDHLAELDAVLNDSDFAATLFARAENEMSFELRPHPSLSTLAALPRRRRPEHVSPLSMVGHTREAYLRLPYGWRETPSGFKTDSYMWHQFVDQRWIRSMSSSLPTVIYLERGAHPGMPTPQRRELLETWNERLLAPGGEAAVRRVILNGLRDEWTRRSARSAGGRFSSLVENPTRRMVRSARRRWG
jgi:glycosyltransferase involved in cell wall biosynthesis